MSLNSRRGSSNQIDPCTDLACFHIVTKEMNTITRDTEDGTIQGHARLRGATRSTGARAGTLLPLLPLLLKRLRLQARHSAGSCGRWHAATIAEVVARLWPPALEALTRYLAGPPAVARDAGRGAIHPLVPLLRPPVVMDPHFVFTLIHDLRLAGLSNGISTVDPLAHLEHALGQV